MLGWLRSAPVRASRAKRIRRSESVVAPGESTFKATLRSRRVSRARYTLYLRGRYQWNMRTEEGLNRSVGYFQEAIDRDPKYALAYAGLADAYNLLGLYGFMPRDQANARASVAATKSLSTTRLPKRTRPWALYINFMACRRRFDPSICDPKVERMPRAKVFTMATLCLPPKP